jgi:hypothetical protein
MHSGNARDIPTASGRMARKTHLFSESVEMLEALILQKVHAAVEFSAKKF